MEIKNNIGLWLQEGRSWYKRKLEDIEVITVHHTGSRYDGDRDEDILADLYGDHIKHDWPGLGYHYVILKNGNTYKINELTDVTWHDTHNWDSIGIALHGYYHEPYDEKPTKEQLASLDKLLDYLCTESPEFPADHDDVKGHRERSSTACPGDIFFPKVVEYRTNLGDVDWESSSPTGITPEELKKTVILWDDEEEKRKTVEWYVNEWAIEKAEKVQAVKDFKEKESLLSVCESKLNEKEGWYKGLMEQVAIMKKHVETIQKSFSEFVKNTSKDRR